MRAETTESIRPELVDPFEPALDLTEAGALEAVVPLAAVAAFRHHTEAQHQPQVLGHRRPAHRQRPREVGHPPLPRGQTLEELAAHGMHDDPEDIVDDRCARGSHPGRLGEENLTCQPPPEPRCMLRSVLRPRERKAPCAGSAGDRDVDWHCLGLMVLPAIITASEESLRAVPQGLREGSLALGASKWQTIRKNVLPYALPGILTSSILGIARVAGETAPIMFTAAYAMKDEMPWQVARWTDFFFQGVMALPYHIYVVSSKIPQNEYTERVQYGSAFVFLFLVMLIALTSIVLRERSRSRLSW